MSLRVKEKSTTLILFRHGCTDYPGEQIYDETHGPGLNSAGHEEALRLSQWVKGLDAAGLYVSPAVRTRQTASPVTESLGLEPMVHDSLRERGFGIWEGLTFQEIEERYPEGLKLWKQNPIGYSPEGGESIVDVERRVAKAFAELIEAHSMKKIVVVTHMGPIRVAISRALEIPLKNYRHLCVPTGSATRLDYGETAINLAYLGVLPGGNTP
jgi:probable phosphoglycerate mutase